jgi:RNAse (barnase) inhibitor barstar
MTFSRLSRLEELLLAGNACINRDYYIFSKLEVEKELVACTVGYIMIMREQLDSGKEKSFDGIGKKIDGKFDALSSSIDQKFETVGKSVESNNGKLVNRFEELQKKLDERNEENVKEIREIKGLLEKIVAMTTKQ